MKRITLTLSVEVFDKIIALTKRLKVSRNDLISFFLEGSTYLRKATGIGRFSASLRLCVKSKKGARKARRSSAVFSCPRGSTYPCGAAGNKRREAERQRSRGGVK